MIEARRHSVAIGVGQVIWIITEILMVRGADWLQLMYGSLGLLIVLLTFQPGLRRYLALGTPRDSTNSQAHGV